MSAPGEGDFRLTCLNGFGDGWNQYAHCMAWFGGRLYVGTSRANMAGMRLAGGQARIRPWPVQCPDDIYDLDRRAQIWEYTPETEQWKQVFRSPVVSGSNGRDDVPSYIGLRGMAVFQAPQDRAPCLYVSSWSPHTAHNPDVLRSEDGQHFSPVKRPPFGPQVRSCRSISYFNGRAHLSPVAAGTRRGFTQDFSSEAVIYASDNLSGGQWQPSNEEGFGNLNNVTVFEMAQFGDHLVAGTANPQQGAELWKSRGGSLPYEWEKIIDRGAGRGALNEVAGALCEFKGALYVGFGIINGGYHRTAGVGPASAEIARFWPDGSWDLIMGESRLTDQGLKYPLSGYGPGFDSLFNGYIWRMCVHQGWLYAGTFNWTNLLPYLPIQAFPADVGAIIRRWGEERLLREYGGAELWRTADGIHWEAVTRSGFGNKFNWGFRTLVSTDAGLFVGTANPFGPTIAVNRQGNWQYQRNPRGGCEVWLGQAAAP